MKLSLCPLALATLIVVPATLDAGRAFAQPPAPRQDRLAFAKGASSATVKGQIKGDQMVDYVVRAAAGQTLAITLKPSNPSTYFNALPPGGADVAMYNGQTGEPYTDMRSDRTIAWASPASRP